MTIVTGLHAVKECLRRTPERVLRLSVQRDRRDSTISELIHLARDEQIQVSQVSRDALNRISEGVAHQGVAAHCQTFKPHDEDAFEDYFETLERPLLLALDGILDPRNLGACMRSAAGAGVDAVLLPRNRSAPLSSAAFKSASGALSTLYIVGVANLARRIDWLREQGVWVVGSDHRAPKTYTDFDYEAPTLVIMGGEEQGLRELTKSRCDELVSIPMAGEISSLNVSVATGIVLYECLRQRQRQS